MALSDRVVRCVIAGSRHFTDEVRAFDVLDRLWPDGVTEVVSGGAKGADAIGEAWAKGRGIPIKQFIPDWSTHGNRAGPRRNREMAKYANAAVCFWDGGSRGTQDMIACALLDCAFLVVVKIPKASE